ncbi:MAG TPA: MBL fold metallo-hydrolase [Candidatus Limnocylindria bacterium]|nr:MBL fold metallo-hydrolase [Candidatus Limnocylindria bacterium]
MIRSSSPGPDAAIDVTFLGHATALIEVAGTRILTDPFLRSRLGPLQRHGPLPDPAGLGVDVVLISHGHADHFDRRSIQALPGSPTIVVPAGLADRLAGAVSGSVIELAEGASLDLGDLRIEAVPARHWVSPGAPRATPVGYVMDAGPRVYFAGDTGRFAGMAERVGRIDLALLPVWTWGPHRGPGHLGPRSAAEAAAEIATRSVIPIHWGTLYPRHLHRVWRRPLQEPGDRFAAHAAALAPDVDVRVLRPGESTTIRPLP